MKVAINNNNFRKRFNNFSSFVIEALSFLILCKLSSNRLLACLKILFVFSCCIANLNSRSFEETPFYVWIWFSVFSLNITRRFDNSDLFSFTTTLITFCFQLVILIKVFSFILFLSKKEDTVFSLFFIVMCHRSSSETIEIIWLKGKHGAPISLSPGSAVQHPRYKYNQRKVKMKRQILKKKTRKMNRNIRS